jgi:hypothetical protein
MRQYFKFFLFSKLLSNCTFQVYVLVINIFQDYKGGFQYEQFIEHTNNGIGF